MGQHKHNPVALAAKRGELPPKPPKLSKREAERMLYAEMMKYLDRKGLAMPMLMAETYADDLKGE